MKRLCCKYVYKGGVCGGHDLKVVLTHGPALVRVRFWFSPGLV